MDQVLRNTAATASVTFYNGSIGADADGTVTVTAKKADGTTLFSTSATNDPAPGVYTTVIPPQATLNQLTLTWTGTFTGTTVSIESNVEIVGGFYFSIAELRAQDKNFDNLTKYPNSALIDARAYVEAEFEDICHRAFVPRYHRETGIVTDYDTHTLWLEKPEVVRFISLKVAGVDQLSWYTAGYLTKDKWSPRIVNLNNVAIGAVYSNVDAEYEYGMTQVPLPIKQKALKRAKMFLMGQTSTLDERAVSMSLPDIGTINLAQPGVRGSETGVPDIDIVLRRYVLDGGAGVF